MKPVPLFEAKNRFSELVTAVERGDEVTITRRGVAVARLVAEPAGPAAVSAERERVLAAIARLRQIRAGVVLQGPTGDVPRF